MPEDGSATPPDARTIVSIAERVAVLETQTKGLMADTAIIRSLQHEISNELQKLIGMGERRDERLAQIVTLTQDLPTIAASARDFAQMHASINDVLDDRQRRKGERGAFMLMGTLLAGSVAIGGSLATAAMWLVGVFQK